MVNTRVWRFACLAGAAAVLGGCVVEPSLSVVPGQGKTYAELQRDDAACRTPVPAGATAAGTDATRAYYQCMAAHGELVVANRTVAYPAYAGYPYYPYAYPYPAYYGYPYSAAYVAPFIGLGIGLGIDRGFYGGRRWHGGFRR